MNYEKQIKICREMSSKIAKYTIKCRKTLETLPAICYNVT